MEIYIYSLLSVLIISLLSLIGIFTITIKDQIFKKYTYLLVSLAVGALLGGAFLHLIPESFEKINNPILVSLEIIIGIILFLIAEKFFNWHYHSGDKCVHNKRGHIEPVGKMMVVSDSIHNLIDGMVIGATYLINIEAGIATTLAIILHEIPKELGSFGVLVHAGYTKTRALWLNFLSALTSFIGVILVLLVGNLSEKLILWLPPIAAGSFIYIAMSDLIPKIHKNNSAKKSILELMTVIIGIGIMWVLLILE